MISSLQDQVASYPALAPPPNPLRDQHVSSGKLGSSTHWRPGRCTGMRLWPESRILSRHFSSSTSSALSMKTCTWRTLASAGNWLVAPCKDKLAAHLIKGRHADRGNLAAEVEGSPDDGDLVRCQGASQALLPAVDAHQGLELRPPEQGLRTVHFPY